MTWPNTNLELIAERSSTGTPSATNSIIYNELDTFEDINAAEWDEVPVVSRLKTTAPVTSSSVLAELETESQSSAEQLEVTDRMKLGLGKMVDEKVDEILKPRGVTLASAADAVVPTLPTHSRAPVNWPFRPVKTATCWFWATPGKECRFTAKACRNLHAFLPTRLGEPTSLHTRKPSWDALADSQPPPSPPHTYLDSFSIPQNTNNFKVRTKTCRYWAKDGCCNYTAENCNYLHEHIAEGVPLRSAEMFLPRWIRGGDQDRLLHVPALEDWPSGKLVKRMNVSDLPRVEASPKIERCEYLASYNWLHHPERPIILVPGSPPLWSPSLSTKRLKEDSGKYFRDPNTARYPHCPTEPAFRALLAVHPDSDLSIFDIFGCGSTLGNLLCFCGGIGKDFRFDIDRVGNTVFLIRKESSPTALIPDVKGYGHSFPEAHTMWEPEVKGSTSHQRIIQYDFGGLKFLVRSESDGYLKQAAGSDAQPTDAETPNTSIALPESKDNLEKAQDMSKADDYALLEGLSVTREPPSTVGSLYIEMRGRRIPQKAIFDLKTRAKETHRPIDMNEVFRRLWVNQTPYFIFAEHFRGSFEPQDIQPMSISDGMSKWEKDHDALLKHYQAIIMEIITATRRSATGKLQVIRRGSGPLEIQERIVGNDADVLPHDLRSKW